jgi:hypothetical protein
MVQRIHTLRAKIFKHFLKQISFKPSRNIFLLAQQTVAVALYQSICKTLMRLLLLVTEERLLLPLCHRALRANHATVRYLDSKMSSIWSHSRHTPSSKMSSNNASRDCKAIPKA